MHRRAWYTHGWNSTTSLRMILTIIPRTPRWLVPPIAVVTTLICIVVMNRERRAARRNLRRVLGKGGWPLQVTLWRLFYNFSRFMVGYCELLPGDAGRIREMIGADGGFEGLVRQALDGGRGVIVLTAHLGNWEMAGRLLTLSGVPVNIAMRVETDNPAERWLRRLREQGSVRVLDMGGDVTTVLALRAALARNEILAMQGDRATGGHDIRVEMFGASLEVPAGPFLLAYSCRVPLIPAFVLHDGWWRWRCECSGPVEFPRTGNRESDLASGAAEYGRQLERMIRRYPEQWFNFYDVWTAKPPS